MVLITTGYQTSPILEGTQTDPANTMRAGCRDHLGGEDDLSGESDQAFLRSC